MMGPAVASQNEPEIDRLMQLHEGEIDIGMAALTLAKEIYPDLDVQFYSKKIDALADKARQLAAGTLDPEKRIRVLNTVIYLREGYRYDRTAFARTKQDYYFLNGILNTKMGICYTMPLLYLSVAQRLNYPIYPVAVPDHLFLRYIEPGFTEQNIEATSGGKYFADALYIEDFSVCRLALEKGSYLRTMSYREFLGHMLAANAFVLAKRGNGNKAITYLEKAVQLDPKSADHHNELANAYLAKSEAVNAESAIKYRDKSKMHAAKAKGLGYTSPELIAIGRETRGK